MHTTQITPFERGIDFITHFTGKPFTYNDLQVRYGISYRQATRLLSSAAMVIRIDTAGFRPKQTLSGPDPYLWEIRA